MFPYASTAKQWLTQNWGNILAGIVASFIVLALQVVSRALTLMLVTFITLKWRLRLLWSLGHPQRIYVVSGAVSGVSEEVKAIVLAGTDAEAANSLIATAGLLYPEVDVRHVYSSIFCRDFYKEDLIVVGGPINNSCAASVLPELAPQIHFDEFSLVVADSTYDTILSNEGNPVRDYGALIRITNPFDVSKSVIMAVGCDTYGVLAAALLGSTRREAINARKSLFSELGCRKYFRAQSYIAVVECDVLGNDVGEIRLMQVVRLNHYCPVKNRTESVGWRFR